MVPQLVIEVPNKRSFSQEAEMEVRFGIARACRDILRGKTGGGH